MYRLSLITRVLATGLALVLGVVAAGCATTKPIVRDQLVVEQYRMRITKVRNAIEETRAVIAQSRGAPYMPELYMRLAELLSEEARYHWMVAYEREQRSNQALHVPQVRYLKEQAIGTYELILERYPDTHLADRILFNISQEQRELGMFDEMRGTLERLVDQYPDSPYQAEALLVLGDYHFDKTEFAKARGYYTRIIKGKASPLQGIAHYKMGWVWVNLADCDKALESFESAIFADRRIEAEGLAPREVVVSEGMAVVDDEFAIPEPEEKGFSYGGHMSLDVQREALVDLTYCYAQERKPEKAVWYLSTMASTREAYVAALRKMAIRYATSEQPLGAAEVSRELLRLAPDEEERLDDARMLHNAVTRMSDFSSVDEDVYLVLRAMRRQMVKPDLTEEQAALLFKEFEPIARDLATRAHRVLMGEEDVAKSTEWKAVPATPLKTARAYEAYLEAIPDSPSRLEIVQNLADVLMDAGRFLEAGHRYREAARLLSEPPPSELSELASAARADAEGDAEDDADEPAPMDAHARAQARLDALYNAVVSYQKSLESEGARTHMERATARAGLRAAGGLYLAEGQPDPDRAKRIKFAVAQSYYDEGNYLQAIDLLTAVAYEYPTTEQGAAAVHMVLDSYNNVNDISGLINVGRRFLADDSPLPGGLQSQIVPIVELAEQRRLDDLSLAASGEQAGGMEVLMAFADRYKDSDLGERALLSTFVAARASGDTGKLYDLGEQIIDQFPHSDQTTGVVGSMGQTALVRFEFDRAIEYLERAANMGSNPNPALLITAGELREQLADRSGAMANYRKAFKAAGDGPLRSDAAVHLADLIEQKGSAQDVVKALKPLASSGDPEIAARLGLALLRTGKPYEAEDQLRQVVEGAAAASAGATARAHYGMAEINLQMLEDFEPYESLDVIEEAVSLVDMVIQGYLAAARQPDPIFSQAALARLARAAEVGAQKVESIRLPADLSAEDRALIEDAMIRRAESLRQGRDEALAECAQRARTTFQLDAAGKACLEGVAPRQDPVRFEGLAARSAVPPVQNLDEPRERLSRNPDDLEALRTVGKAFMDVGDHHAARLVLSRTVEAGGDAADLNLLGVASYEAGDRLGALRAFARARNAGSVAAALNLAFICKQEGLADLARDLLEDLHGPVDGTLLDGAGAMRAGGGR